MDCYQRGVVQYDSGTVDYALGTIHYDDGSLVYVKNSISNDISQIQRDIAAVENASRVLRSAVAANVTGTPAAAFSPAAVSAALGGAQQQITSSTETLEHVQAQAAVFDKEAAQLDAAAKQFASNLKC